VAPDEEKSTTRHIGGHNLSSGYTILSLGYTVLSSGSTIFHRVMQF